MYVIIHSSKSIERATPIMNSDVKCGLCVIMTCQCKFIDFSKCLTPLRHIDDEGGCACVRMGVDERSLYFPFNFAANLEHL